MVVAAIMSVWILSTPLLFYILGRKTGESMGIRKARLRQEVLDYLQGMAEHQIYGSDVRKQSLIKDCELLLIKDQLRMAILGGFGSALFIFVSGIAVLLIIYTVSGENSSGLLDGPIMAMIIYGVLASLEALMPLPGAFQFLGHTYHAANRLREAVNLPAIPFQEKDSGKKIKGKIQLSDISCGYQYDQPVFKKQSLTIPAGNHIALLGKTGCGKSTLVKVLSRDLELTSGQVLLDGNPIKTFSKNELYDSITFVPQKTHVFSATLRENLLLDGGDSSSNDEVLLKVIDQSGLSNLAAGRGGDYNLLNVWLGQGGIALSGGEQRRLAIARALLRPAPILVMDEPGEGLDSYSERILFDKIFRSFKNSTIIMITHKLTLLERMDNVYRIENGRILST